MELKLYNSLTKKTEVFKPEDSGVVRMYSCGPTVYKRQHIGNMRRYLFSDFLHRTLEFFDYKVKEITNITDVGHLTQDEIDSGEDKLEKAARETTLTPQDIAEKQSALFLEDIAKLNIKRSDMYPRATDHISEMQEMIKVLIDKGYAYERESGVYFDVQKFSKYGRLSGNSLDDLVAGQRVGVNPEKKHPADFALWIVDPSHLQKWDSPWGVGYPGWHIECSAMSLKYLGPLIDIHTGGEDNRFPHHENEIAQSEAATDETFVKYWMHNRHLKMGGKKIAKREGEQISLDTLAERGYSPLSFRLFVFGIHYRSPADFSWESLDEAQEHLDQIRSLLRRINILSDKLDLNSEDIAASEPDEEVVLSFSGALAEDLNTPAAFAILLDFISSINKRLETDKLEKGELAQIIATFHKLDTVVGVIEVLEKELESEKLPQEIEDMVNDREEARLNQDFDRADTLRSDIEEKGFVVEDTDKGPRTYPKN